jgi:prophage maintenance system killer protein
MSQALYLTLEEVLALHAALLARHGGAPGVRDRVLVERVLARARSGYTAA